MLSIDLHSLCSKLRLAKFANFCRHQRCSRNTGLYRGDNLKAAGKAGKLMRARQRCALQGLVIKPVFRPKLRQRGRR